MGHGWLPDVGLIRSCAITRRPHPSSHGRRPVRRHVSTASRRTVPNNLPILTISQSACKSFTIWRNTSASRKVMQCFVACPAEPREPRFAYQVTRSLSAYEDRSAQSIHNNVPFNSEAVAAGEVVGNGRYSMIGKLGWGRTSTVWLARDLQRHVS